MDRSSTSAAMASARALLGGGEPGVGPTVSLDQERRRAIDGLISLLTNMAGELQVLTTSTLAGDGGRLGSAAAVLQAIVEDPVLDLTRMSATYAALRRVVIERHVEQEVGQPREAPVSAPPATVRPERLDAAPQFVLRWPVTR